MSILLSYICYEKILTRLKKLYFYKSACVTSRVAMGTLKKFPSIWSSAVWPVTANIYIHIIQGYYCEHDLFVYIVKQKQNFVDFKNNFFFDGTNFENSIIHKPSLGSREVIQQIRARSVQQF